MIPDINAIVEMLIAGECTAQQALGWINTHMENADLRDHYAGLAMQGLLAFGATYSNKPDRDALAIDAYGHADAMLKVRAP